MERKFPPHPSGRKIERREIKGRSIWRIPDRGFNIPRLNDSKVNAIGFTVGRLPGSDDDDDC